MSIYDMEPPMGQFIKIEPGKTVKFRLVGEGHTFQKTFKGDVSQRFLSVVIFRNSQTKANEIKVFEFGWSIMGQLNKLFKDEDFGPLDQYDIKVERQGEGMQTKYFVKALPKAPLTAAEKALVAEAAIDLEAIAKKGAEPVVETTETQPVYDPFADQ
jgi:hypothetical protein